MTPQELRMWAANAARCEDQLKRERPLSEYRTWTERRRDAQGDYAVLIYQPIDGPVSARFEINLPG